MLNASWEMAQKPERVILFLTTSPSLWKHRMVKERTRYELWDVIITCAFIRSDVPSDTQLLPGEVTPKASLIGPPVTAPE